VIAFGQECGKIQNQNVDDTNNKLPWSVQLRERSTNEVFCIGTLISNRHILVGEFLTFRLLASVASSFFYQPLTACGRNPTTRL
jgi:hypothetical protein